MYFAWWDTFVISESNFQDLFLFFYHICCGDFNFRALGLVESSISLERTIPLPKCDLGYPRYPGQLCLSIQTM